MRRYEPDEYDELIDEVDSAINGPHRKNYANQYGRQQDRNPYRNQIPSDDTRWDAPDYDEDYDMSEVWQDAWDEDRYDPYDAQGAYEELDGYEEDPEAAAMHYNPQENRGVIRAYNADFEKTEAYKTQQRRTGEKRRVPRDENMPQRKPQSHKPAKKKRRHPILKFLLILLLLVALAVAALWIFAKQPESDKALGTRKPGCASILLAGTDAEGTRTDTMMLLYLDEPNRQMNLLSLPRDTYTSSGTSVPKLNSIYGNAGGGKEGMEALLDYAEQCVGYRPDGYILTDLDCFVDLVNLMGGVNFDVPCDMWYSDPTQELEIDLKAGQQKLSGEEAMWLVRYRSGYAMADLERVNVQRDFISAAMDQWLSVKNLYKAPAAAGLITANTTTNLNLRNLAWVAKTAKRIGTGNMQTNTLPGEATYVGDGSYYVLYPQATADLVNQYYNPYETPVSGEQIYSPFY